MKIRYFAWLRERIGTAEEERDLPENLVTVADLIAWLSRIDEGYAYAFEQPETIRVAINQEHVEITQPLLDAKEIAFFPPMTGG
ncbi:molybdopterin converting factor subunit 1 [Polycladidibacter stylochi]|uniref:molybdopterin converting factor subunit 1 n=1 Tax=Polycladidibacter stylochi TaxID=1807766 RepID=UPI00082D3967|nr:molybdopterin converting factor subunit 1 [Pseudovibrio stylochi]